MIVVEIIDFIIAISLRSLTINNADSKCELLISPDNIASHFMEDKGLDTVSFDAKANPQKGRRMVVWTYKSAHFQAQQHFI